MASTKVETNTTFVDTINFVADQLVDEDTLNEQISGNIDALHEPAYGLAILDEAADITVSSGGAFADLDAAGTEFTLTITTAGGPVLIGLSGSVFTGSTVATGYFDITVDGVRIGGDDGLFVVQVRGASSIAYAPINFTTIYVPAAGSHTFVVQCKAATGNIIFLTGAGTSGGDIHPRFFVIEI